MKIGEFATFNNTTIDTIRHYMDMSLLTPEKKGTFYEFDESDQTDFETILKFKDIGFSLSEIQTLMLFEKIGRHTGYTRRVTYKTFFENKLRWIEEEILKLEQMKDRLNKSLNEIEETKTLETNSAGVPIEALALFHCYKCDQPYEMTEGYVQQGKVVTGVLNCACDKALEIKKGIIYGEGALKAEESPTFDDSFIEDYITTTHVGYLKNLQLAVQWNRKNFELVSGKSGLILDLGSGRGFFLRNMLDLLPSDAYYIAVDHNPNAHQWLAKAMEGVKGSERILYLCCDFKNIPLKGQSVDLLIDATGSTNYAFDNAEFLLDSIMPLLKMGSKIFGHYIIFHNFKTNTLIPKESRKWFTKEKVADHLSELGFIVEIEFETSPISQGGPKESFFIPGEKINNYLIVGKYK